MAYRVEYEPGKREKQHSGRFPLLLAGCILAFLVLVNSLWPQGAQVLRQWLIPGNPVVTVAALESFAEELKDGQPISDSLERFCKRILDDGKAAR